MFKLEAFELQGRVVDPLAGPGAILVAPGLGIAGVGRAQQGGVLCSLDPGQAASEDVAHQPGLLQGVPVDEESDFHRGCDRRCWARPNLSVGGCRVNRLASRGSRSVGHDGGLRGGTSGTGIGSQGRRRGREEPVRGGGSSGCRH